jgi:hypothetical protein
MSALPPIADMCGAKRDVRFVPIVDILRFIRSAAPYVITMQQGEVLSPPV